MTYHIGEATKKVIDLDALEKRLNADSRQNITRYFGDLSGAIVAHELLRDAAAAVAELKERRESMQEAEDAAKDLQENGIEKLMDTFESKGVDYAEMVAIRSCLVSIRAFLARNGKGEG